MIDLNEKVRRDQGHPIFGKIASLIYPTSYLAENLADFRKNVSQIKVLFNPLKILGDRFGRYFRYANIAVPNVSIEKTAKKDWFTVYDNSGKEKMFWADEFHPLGTPFSFKRACHEQFLKEQDQVSSLYFRYFPDSHLCNITLIDKFNRYSKKQMHSLEKLVPVLQA